MVIEACRAMLTERFRLMCKQRGRQQHGWRTRGSRVGALHFGTRSGRVGEPTGPVPIGV